MSVLEIVLYSLLGVGFTIWIVITIVDFKRKKNKPRKEDQEDED